MVVDIKYEDLPSEVVDFAKKLILDTLGVTIAGSSQEAIPAVVELAKETGGKEESLIPFYGGKVAAAMAAFAIGPMSRALDMGDVHEKAGHSAEYTLPALLAATGLKGSVTGKEFIAAFVVGEEIMIRIGEEVDITKCIMKLTDPGHYIFGAVAAVGKLLKLNLEELQNAMGMAAAMTQPHDMQMYAEACHMARIHHGFLCQDALNICLLSKKGITGPHAILLGTRGFLGRFDKVERNPKSLTADLGEDWHFTTTMMKPYTCCKCAHTAIDGIIALMDEHKFSANDIERIHIDESSMDMTLVVEPKAAKWNPHSTPECQFSLPYTVATAAFDKRVFLDSYTQEAKSRKEVRELMTKITAEEDKDLPPLAARVTVRLKDGTKLTKEVIYIKGHVTKPFTLEELITKFKWMIPYSAYQLTDDTVNSLIETVLRLEDVNDVVKGIIIPLTPIGT
jgi:2-methylcitrate dehydratase PrpD